MRRALVWGGIALAAALLIWVAAAESFFRPLLAVAPVVVYSVVLLVRVVMEPAPRRPVPLHASDERPVVVRASDSAEQLDGADPLEMIDPLDSPWEGRAVAG
jgi:hypothetical protein